MTELPKVTKQHFPATSSANGSDLHHPFPNQNLLKVTEASEVGKLTFHRHILGQRNGNFLF